MKMRRNQRVFVVQRKSDEMFCTNLKDPNWSGDIRLAAFIAKTKFQGVVRAVWGRDMDDYRLIEVVPARLDDQED